MSRKICLCELREKLILFYLVTVTVVIICLFLIPNRASAAQEAAQTFTLDGTLYSDAAGTTPMVDSSIELVVQILNPAQNCILYEETQTVDTSLSSGVFSIQVGSATSAGKRTGNDSNNDMQTVYSNTVASFSGKLVSNGATCTYTPATKDQRYVKMKITPSYDAVQRVISTNMSVDSVPSAVVAERAETVQGFSATQLLRVNTTAPQTLTQTNLESIFSTTGFSRLTTLLSVDPTTFAQNGAGSSTSSYIINTDSDNAGADGGVNFQNNGSNVARVTSYGNFQAGAGSASAPSLTFLADTDTGLYNPSTNILSLVAGGIEGLRVNSIASGVNYVELTPAVTGNGPIVGSAGLDTNINLNIKPKGTGNTIFSSGSVAIGVASPDTKFHVVGTSGNTLKIVDGNQGTGKVLTSDSSGVASWSTPASSGMTTLNTLTATTQTFATGASGTTPAWSSATSTHTLNIPMASAVGVTAGLLSKTDYDSFAGKQSATLNNGQILIGNASNVATAVTPSGDITLSNAGAVVVTKIQGSGVSVTAPTTAGQMLRWSGAAWTPGFVAMTDLRSTITGTNQFASSCLSNQTLTYNSVGDIMSCANISLPAGQVTGTLPAANGGTGNASYAAGDLLYASDSTTLTRLAAGTNTHVLTLAGGVPTWAAPSGGGSGTLSGLTAATGTNTLANANYAQAWNWDTLTTQNAMSMGSTSATSGTLLNLANSNNSSSSVGNILKVSATGASNAAVPLMITNAGTGNSFRINDDGTDTDSTPFVVDASGNVGIGTTGPATKLQVAGTVKVADGGETCSAVGDGGMIRYNSTSLQFCNGSSWQTLGTGSGGVTSITAGTGLTGGTIIGTGTIGLGTELTGVNAIATTGFVKRTGSGAYSAANLALSDLPSMTNNRVLANVSGSAAVPAETTVTSLLDSLGTTQGSLLYRNGSAWVPLVPGTSGQVLQSGGAAANPSWTTPSAGTVTSVTASAPLSSSGGATPDISLTGTVPVANGGTGVTSFGNYMVLGTGVGGALSPISGSASGSVLQYSMAGPAYSTATFPTTTTVNQLLYSSSANTVVGLATANSSVLTTNGSGVPSWTTASTDTFSQYALLAGRSGGQTINGGTAASHNLTLDSTSNGTKGFVLLNPTSGNVGIGTTSPGATLDVKGNFKISGSSSGAVGFAVPAAAGSATYTLPNAYPATNGQVLSSTTAGTMSWSSLGSTIVSSKTSNFTVGTSEDKYLYLVSNATTGTLPAVATVATGFQVTIKRVGTSNVLIQANGAETIDGVNSRNLISNQAFVTLVNNGTSWSIVGGGATVPSGACTPGSQLFSSAGVMSLTVTAAMASNCVFSVTVKGAGAAGTRGGAGGGVTFTYTAAAAGTFNVLIGSRGFGTAGGTYGGGGSSGTGSGGGGASAVLFDSTLMAVAGGGGGGGASAGSDGGAGGSGGGGGSDATSGSVRAGKGGNGNTGGAGGVYTTNGGAGGSSSGNGTSSTGAGGTANATFSVSGGGGGATWSGGGGGGYGGGGGGGSNGSFDYGGAGGGGYINSGAVTSFGSTAGSAYNTDGSVLIEWN